jgi:DNA-binding response OmpR family regulator
LKYGVINKNLLIIDDDCIQGVFLKKILSRKGYDIAYACDGESIPKKIVEKRTNMVILGISLKGKDGFYWLSWLQQYYPHIPVIIASSIHLLDDRLLGLKMGARDYLTKPFHVNELLIRIENIFNYSFINKASKKIKIGDFILDTMANCVLKKDCVTKLTVLEVNILKLLYLNAGAVLTRDDIMEHVRGVKHNPLDRSIDVHINKIRKKIEPDPAHPTYIHTIRGKGYCLQNPVLL